MFLLKQLFELIYWFWSFLHVFWLLLLHIFTVFPVFNEIVGNVFLAYYLNFDKSTAILDPI